MQHARCIYPDAILKYGESAELYVQHIAGKTFDELEKEYGTIPAAFSQASLMIASTLAEFNEPNPHTGMFVPMLMFKLPYSIKILVEKYSQPGIEQRIAYIENRKRYTTSEHVPQAVIDAWQKMEDMSEEPERTHIHKVIKNYKTEGI